MKFEHRSFGGKVFRPTPVIESDPALGIVIVATAWGNSSSAKKVIRIMKEYIINFRQDTDVTSPFQRLSCLSPNSNNLRIATMLANDILYREDNKDEYITGVEVFAASIHNQELSWLQMGHPNIFLSRKNRILHPLGSQMDLSVDLSRDERLLSPLPGNLLGLDSSANFTLGSFVPQTGDKMILVSRSDLPNEFFTSDNHPKSVDELSMILGNNDPELAFWLGAMSL